MAALASAMQGATSVAPPPAPSGGLGLIGSANAAEGPTQDPRLALAAALSGGGGGPPPGRMPPAPGVDQLSQLAMNDPLAAPAQSPNAQPMNPPLPPSKPYEFGGALPPGAGPLQQGLPMPPPPEMQPPMSALMNPPSPYPIPLPPSGAQSAPNAQAAAPQNASAPQNPAVDQEYMNHLLSVATNWRTRPAIAEAAMAAYQQQMQLLMPHPATWHSIPGQDREAQLDWMGNPTGKTMGGAAPRFTMKDTAGNEYSVNALDHSDIVRASDLAAGGRAAPSGQYASPFPPNMAKTDPMKEYEGYLAQQSQTGQPPMSFNGYVLEKARSAAAQTIYGQEGAAQAEIGKHVGQNMGEYIDAAKDSRTKLQALNMIGDILKRYGGNITTGPGAASMLKVKQSLANAFPGTFGESAGPAEMLQKLSTQLATADAKSLASRPTQFDFSTYLKNNPGIQMSIDGQKALVAIKAQQAQHDIELGNMALKKENSTHPENWGDVVTQYDKDHPIINPGTGKPFDPNSTDFPELRGEAATGPATPSVPYPKVGDVQGGYKYIGGDPHQMSSWTKQ